MDRAGTAMDIVEALGLRPHPEGGHFVETWRGDPMPGSDRAVGTAILFLLSHGEVSHWHRVDAAELWHFHAGAPIELRIASDGMPVRREILGMDLAAGQRPQVVVPTGAWQSARSLGDWTLVGCTVSPGFDWPGFVMAPAGWEPPVSE